MICLIPKKGLMGTILFDDGQHRCVAFSDLVQGEEGVQANQFLIIDQGQGALLDPGGDLLYTPLWLGISSYLQLPELRWLLASHQDPDIVGAIGRWLANTPAQVACSRLWGRFVPHNISNYQQLRLGDERYVLLPDEGGYLPLGAARIMALPAHFMHSVGNFSFFDPVSRILFSGDIGASLMPTDAPCRALQDFSPELHGIRAFHQRYMASNRVTRLWVAMVRQLDPALIAPQHGYCLMGAAIPAFLDWLENLPCGVDLLDERHYRLPVPDPA